MKEILKEYISALREIKRLKEKQVELIRQLYHAKLPDGNEIADVILSNRATVADVLKDNLPDDIKGCEELEALTIRDSLYFMKRDEEVKAGRINGSAGCYSRLEGNITDGSHEGW